MDYQLHDTHGHLDLLLQKQEILEDLDSELGSDTNSAPFVEARDRAGELIQNHELFIQPTVSTTNFILNYELWQNIDKIKILVGSHPEIVTADFEVSTYIRGQREFLERTVFPLDSWKSKVVGIGECGLDYYYSQDLGIKSKQRELFESQIALAIELELPLVIHCRDAFDDVLGILSNFKLIHGRFDVHCFTGNNDIARKILDLGGFCGIGGIATFKNGEVLRQAVEYIPIEKILIETDLPFLAPIPHRGEICLPDYIEDTATLISKLKGISQDKLWNQLRCNVRDLYRL